MANVKIEEGWKTALADEWEAPYFNELTQFVSARYKEARIYPPGSRIFAAFDSCPYHNLCVIHI